MKKFLSSLLIAGIVFVLLIFVASPTQAIRGGGTKNFTSIYLGGTQITSTATEINLMDGVTATTGEINYLDLTTLGTAEASKVLALDGSLDLTYPTGTTIVYQSGATWTAESGSTVNVAGTFQIGGTTQASTATEVDAQADLSARMVTSSGTETLTVAAHEGRITTLTGSGSAFTRTLPAATGTGAIYRFSVGVANTSNHVINVTTTDIMHGVIMSGDTDDGTTDYIWQTAADSDTITLNGTATGGIVGDWIELRDTVSGTWEVFGYTNSSGASEATPFSAAVS